MKRTALYEQHKAAGGRLIDFGGWELPVQYSSVMEEHTSCRTTGGIFDVSHMGEFHVEGPGSAPFLDYLVSNHVSGLNVGQAQYNLLCNADGGIVDDLVIYRRGPERFLLVVNASNTDKDFQHCTQVLASYRERHPAADRENLIQLTNESARYSQIALQGRIAESLLQPYADVSLTGIKTYCFAEGLFNKSIPAIFARTGYTGEDGFEIYVPWDSGPLVWNTLLEAGRPRGLLPCGLGARDTLRLEMKYPLYGHELNDTTNPFEAGLGWVVKLQKGDFVGLPRLLVLKERGNQKQLIGFKLLERGIPRQGYTLVETQTGKPIGEVTSGTQSPSLKEAIGVGYVNAQYAAVGTEIGIEIRGQVVKGQVVKTPFYTRPY